jgi:hypothetical protein
MYDCSILFLMSLRMPGLRGWRRETSPLSLGNCIDEETRADILRQVAAQQHLVPSRLYDLEIARRIRLLEKCCATRYFTGDGLLQGILLVTHPEQKTLGRTRLTAA